MSKSVVVHVVGFMGLADSLALTVWKNGEWHVWGEVDAVMASEDPDYLMTIGATELNAAIEAATPRSIKLVE